MQEEASGSRNTRSFDNGNPATKDPLNNPKGFRIGKNEEYKRAIETVFNL